VPALVAPDAGEAVVRIAALDVAIDHPPFDRASQAPRRAQLRGTAPGALPQRAGARVARPIQAPGAGAASMPAFAPSALPQLPSIRGETPPAAEKSTSRQAPRKRAILCQHAHAQGRLSPASGRSAPWAPRGRATSAAGAENASDRTQDRTRVPRARRAPDPRGRRCCRRR